MSTHLSTPAAVPVGGLPGGGDDGLGVLLAVAAAARIALVCAMRDEVRHIVEQLLE